MRSPKCGCPAPTRCTRWWTALDQRARLRGPPGGAARDRSADPRAHRRARRAAGAGRGAGRAPAREVGRAARALHAASAASRRRSSSGCAPPSSGGSSPSARTSARSCTRSATTSTTRCCACADSYHTEGFYKRESSLFHQLVPEARARSGAPASRRGSSASPDERLARLARTPGRAGRAARAAGASRALARRPAPRTPGRRWRSSATCATPRRCSASGSATILAMDEPALDRGRAGRSLGRGAPVPPPRRGRWRWRTSAGGAASRWRR